MKCTGYMEILEKTENYIESRDYISWERFFTAKLVEISDKTYLKYSKSKLNTAYLNEKVEAKVLNQMKGISLKK